MDQTKHHQNIYQLFMNVQFLKRVTTKLVLSLSLFSLLFSHSNWVYEILMNFKFFSSFPTKLITHTLDKNYIFVLCNLLVLLAKYSGFVTSSSKHDNNSNNINEYYTYKTFQDFPRPETLIMEEDHHQMRLDKNQEDEVDQHQESSNQDGQIEQIITIDEDKKCDDDHQEKEDQEEVAEEEGFNEEQAGWMFWEEIEEKEDEETGGNGKLSTEELNKKFDEFIRKMKEELRIEARRQLVMV